MSLVASSLEKVSEQDLLSLHDFWVKDHTRMSMKLRKLSSYLPVLRELEGAKDERFKLLQSPKPYSSSSRRS